MFNHIFNDAISFFSLIEAVIRSIRTVVGRYGKRVSVQYVEIIGSGTTQELPMDHRTAPIRMISEAQHADPATRRDESRLVGVRLAPSTRRSFVACAAAAIGCLGASLLAGCHPGERFGEFVLDETPPAEDAGSTGDESPAFIEHSDDDPLVSDAMEDTARLYIGIPAFVSSLDPVACTTLDEACVARCVVEGLVRETDDGLGVEPCLAESWDVDDTGCVYTFHLPSGLVFSDGSPVTSDDWLWSFERALAATDAPWHAPLDAIAHVSCPDDLSVEVTFSNAESANAAILCTYALGVQSKARYDATEKSAYGTMAAGIDAAPLGTGAWAFSSWIYSDSIELAANGAYREEGAPLLAGVVFKTAEDPTERMLMLQRGTVDVASAIPGEQASEIQSDPNCTMQSDADTETPWSLPAGIIAEEGGDPSEGQSSETTGESESDGADAFGLEAVEQPDFIALRKTVENLVRTPMGAWRLETTEKAGE